MYYKIHTEIDEKYVNIGMINIRASFYLEEEDEGYEKYISVYFKRNQFNPFRHHEKQFKPNVTEKEILDYFDLVSDSIHATYLNNDIHCLKNDSNVDVNIYYLSRKALYDSIKAIPINKQTADMKIELAKIETAKSKEFSFNEIDFSN